MTVVYKSRLVAAHQAAEPLQSLFSLSIYRDMHDTRVWLDCAFTEQTDAGSFASPGDAADRTHGSSTEEG